jgi:iron-sulfur cluster repair protein YtfE (RIC family)
VKRDPSLASRSRDHHQALAIAQKLRRAAADNSEEARQALHALGRRLDAHARLEERELFPLIESAMTARDLAALARALSRAESSRDE